MEKYKTGDQVCPDNSGKALDIKSVFTAFIPLAFGVVMGLAFIAIEFVIKKNNLKTTICLYGGDDVSLGIDGIGSATTKEEDLSKSQLLEIIGQLRGEVTILSNKLALKEDQVL